MLPCADLYADLGLPPGADEAAIRRAFRRRAFELHPDRNPGPDAAEAFLRVRAAYEALLDPSHREAVEAEAVVQAMMRAAAAARSEARMGPPPRPLCFELDPLVPGLVPVVAGRVAAGLAASAAIGFALAALADVAFTMAGVACLVAAPAVWLTRRRPAALHVYADGFADDRWPAAGRVGWGDIEALDPDDRAGTLDLALAAPAAERLATLPDPPRNVLVWQGDRPFYRLPLGDQFDPAVRAVEARTGLRAR